MNRNVYQLAEMPWSKVVLIGLGCLALYYFLLFDDGSSLQNAFGAATEQLHEAERQLKNTKEAVADADRFEREVKDTVAQFQHIVEYMPDKMGSGTLTTLISEQGNKAGVRVLQTLPIDEATPPSTESADFYTTSRVKFTMEGSFTQIANFLSLISRIPHLLTFENVEIAASEGGSLQEPKLSFNGAIVGYRYRKAEPPSDQGGEGAVNGEVPNVQ